MKEHLKGYLLDSNQPPSLENIDFDTALYLKRAKLSGHAFEFGKYDWIDETVDITIERPDPQRPRETEQEWRERREWYIKNAPTSRILFEQGVAEGYLNEDEWLLAVSSVDSGLEKEISEWFGSDYGDLIEQQEKMQQKEARSLIRRQRYQDRRPPSFRRMMAFARTHSLDLDLPEDFTKNPWQVYEAMKQSRGLSAKTAREYEIAIAEILDITRL